MKYLQSLFDKAIRNIVTGIAPGHIMSYGDVARLAGFPGYARMVSKAMCRSVVPLPWYRVVKSDRTLAFEEGSDMYNKQKRLLEKEGVSIINRKVVPIESGKAIDLDKLLWGYPDA